MIERVTVSEHYLAVEYVPVRPPERRMKPRDKAPEMVATDRRVGKAKRAHHSSQQPG